MGIKDRKIQKRRFGEAAFILSDGFFEKAKKIFPEGKDKYSTDYMSISRILELSFLRFFGCGSCKVYHNMVFYNQILSKSTRIPDLVRKIIGFSQAAKV